MEDKLKSFVSKHRDEFDVYEPRQELWQEICQELPAKEKEAKVISISFGEKISLRADVLFMRVAAAILLLLGCGLTLFLMKQNVPASNQVVVANTAESQSANALTPELVEIEAYYASQISRKKQELTAYDLKALGLDEQQLIDKELAKLDSSYMQLRKQLYTTPNTTKVMDAMIQNLQIRIEVLNRQLEVLQRIEKFQEQPIEKKNDETNV
jgi:hypothetical protein